MIMYEEPVYEYRPTGEVVEMFDEDFRYWEEVEVVEEITISSGGVNPRISRRNPLVKAGMRIKRLLKDKQ